MEDGNVYADQSVVTKTATTIDDSGTMKTMPLLLL